jgi:hypothetical protein
MQTRAPDVAAFRVYRSSVGREEVGGEGIRAILERSATSRAVLEKMKVMNERTRSLASETQNAEAIQCIKTICDLLCFAEEASPPRSSELRLEASPWPMRRRQRHTASLTSVHVEGS